MGAYLNGFYAFAPVTDSDHSGLVWVAAILSLVFSFLTIITRYYIKKRNFGTDDYFILAAQVVAVGQYIAIFIGLGRFDLGKSTFLIQAGGYATEAGQSIVASSCIFIIALALSKCSVICFLKRIFAFESRKARLTCNVMLGMIGVWALASILILTIGCGPASKVAGDRCSGQVLRWGLVTAFDGLSEIVVVLLSVTLVLPLQMALDIKLAVVSAFSFRIFVAVFSGIHVGYISVYGNASDAGLAIVPGLIWQQIELGYALVSATIPVLKSFIRGYEKAMGFGSTYSRTGGMLSSNHQLHSFHNKSQVASRLRDGDLQPEDLRPDVMHYNANVSSAQDAKALPKRTLSNGSGDSQDPIIRKDVHFHVTSESVV